MKIKQESKYIDSTSMKGMYGNLTGHNLTILKILHKTGIRISELKEVVNYINHHTLKVGGIVKLKPAKRNGVRNIPAPIDHGTAMELKDDISLETNALQKRIRNGHAGISPHDFRATFITNALALDLNPVKIQRIVGHKELQSTLKYNRLNTEYDLGMYDYITSDPQEGNTSTDVAFLKQQLKVLAEQNAKLKYKLEGKK